MHYHGATIVGEHRIAVTVEDDGHGVPTQIVNRIFDPFFTTREPGSGTGLGLHLSRQIIAEDGGHLRHQGRDGGGARFAFDVPASWCATSDRLGITKKYERFPESTLRSAAPRTPTRSTLTAQMCAVFL